jgi:hypothetical protein
MIGRFYSMTLLAAAALTAAPVHAQEPEAEGPPRVYVGVQGMYARPVGEFHDYVKHGGGLNINVVFPVMRESPLALRADGGFIVYGSETRRVCFSSTVGCRILLDLTTTNSIAYINIGPQLMLPAGPVRPYVNAAIGGTYFGTTSSIEGSNDDEDFASTTNFDDLTFAWNAGGGLLIRLGGAPASPVLLDLAVRYHGNGEAEYLKEGDITDNPDGSITITPTRSEANLLSFQIGVSIGAGGRR